MAAPPPAPRLAPPSRAEPGGSIALAAAAYAVAELAAGLLLGFLDSGRAEAAPFIAARPWLLAATAAAAAAWPLRRRAALYGLALALAAAAETILVLRVGARSPWPEAAWGLAGAAAAALFADLAAQAGRRWLGRHGRWLGAAGAALALLVPGAQRPYEALVQGKREAAVAAQRPRILLMTGLPLVWGEAGPFDPGSRPAAAYGELQREFEFVPIDLLDRANLALGGLLFLAQPQRLAPSELVALDAWVREGGGAVILADPRLAWPSRLPPGDIRRPPSTTMLGPLLAHWGLGLEAPDDSGRLVYETDSKRIAVEAPGRLIETKRDCVVSAVPWQAICRLGEGRVLVVADADLLRDELWAPLGRDRARRTADNPMAVADWLDWAAGLTGKRQRIAAPVAWANAAPADHRVGLALALLPVAACAGIGLLLRRRRKR
ncbi:MAG TPA: hypothetical protein VFZ91_12220 [Allosphingosinicella sp.]